MLKVVAQVCRKMQQWNANLTYVCDPVMGDNGKLYVPAEVVEVFKTDILPLASVLTPNQFETEVLSGEPVHHSYHSITNDVERGVCFCIAWRI
jgi:pyridoxine kinase